MLLTPLALPPTLLSPSYPWLFTSLGNTLEPTIPGCPHPHNAATLARCPTFSLLLLAVHSVPTPKLESGFCRSHATLGPVLAEPFFRRAPQTRCRDGGV